MSSRRGERPYLCMICARSFHRYWEQTFDADMMDTEWHQWLREYAYSKEWCGDDACNSQARVIIYRLALLLHRLGIRLHE